MFQSFARYCYFILAHYYIRSPAPETSRCCHLHWGCVSDLFLPAVRTLVFGGDAHTFSMQAHRCLPDHGTWVCRFMVPESAGPWHLGLPVGCTSIMSWRRTHFCLTIARICSGDAHTSILQSEVSVRPQNASLASTLLIYTKGVPLLSTTSPTFFCISAKKV